MDDKYNEEIGSKAEKRRQLGDATDQGSSDAKRQKIAVVDSCGDNDIQLSNVVADSKRRKKVAVLMAYSGKGYYGMQRNRDVNTIEGDLLSALLKVGIITEENCEVPQTMHFQRAARTDKGVSAARQVVSLRIAFDDGLVEKINAHLPLQIRVFDIKRGTKGFNSKLWCDARSYSYTLPTFAFAPITEVLTKQYRVTDDIVDRVNEILTEFKGTHNFHNFTSGKKFDDNSAQRYIMDFKCGRPFVEGQLELVVLTIKGQSFMLHQIRKMIGLVIAIMRDLANPDLITRAYRAERLDLPIAPGVGLVLEEVHYDKYNKRYGSDGIHDILDWTKFSESIEEFKKNFIHPTILKAETEDNSMLQWLSTLMLHTFDVRHSGLNSPSNVRTQFSQTLCNLQQITNDSATEEQKEAPNGDLIGDQLKTTIDDRAATKFQSSDAVHNGT